MLNSCLLIYELLWRETQNNSDANTKTAGLQRSLSFCFVLVLFSLYKILLALSSHLPGAEHQELLTNWLSEK